MRRAAGILLHPTSLPGAGSTGDLGPAVDRFLDWAAEAGFGWWQILPLVPPARGDSPYTALSTFAGNPLLVSPRLLVDDGLLLADELPPPAVADEPAHESMASGADSDAAARRRTPLLRRAFARYEAGDGIDPALRDDLESLRAAPEQDWLDDWALFSALRERHGERPWNAWPAPLARRDPAALAAAARELAAEVRYHRFVQLLFLRQWRRVRRAAAARGIGIFGDLPIYVAHDSAEVWARPDLFELDDAGRPIAVAGVPPDYFSATGQRWGNPVYRWDRLAADGYRWWVRRLAAALRQVDLLRLDHFRGFVGWWRVPVEHETAVHGEWRDGPGRELFAALRHALGDLPLVAEDLGVLTADVDGLRDELDMPGMRVLQFGFDGDPGNPHPPHRLDRRTVVYTGTHDNDTTVGWYRGLDRATRKTFHDYVGRTRPRPHRELVRLAYTSVADLAVVPAQDVLGLGSEARMNVPGEAAGNWRWRLRDHELGTTEARWLRRLAEVSGRLPG